VEKGGVKKKKKNQKNHKKKKNNTRLHLQRSRRGLPLKNGGGGRKKKVTRRNDRPRFQKRAGTWRTWFWYYWKNFPSTKKAGGGRNGVRGGLGRKRNKFSPVGKGVERGRGVMEKFFYSGGNGAKKKKRKWWWRGELQNAGRTSVHGAKGGMFVILPPGGRSNLGVKEDGEKPWLFGAVWEFNSFCWG